MRKMRMHLVWVSWHFCNETRPLRSHLTSHIQRVEGAKSTPTLPPGAAATCPNSRQAFSGAHVDEGVTKGWFLLQSSHHHHLELCASLHTFVCPSTYTRAPPPALSQHVSTERSLSFLKGALFGAALLGSSHSRKHLPQFPGVRCSALPPGAYPRQRV